MSRRRPRIAGTLCVEIGDLEYEISCADFSPPIRGDAWYQGDGGECSPGPFVVVTNHAPAESLPDVVTYDTFLIDYAIDRNLPLADADARVCRELMEIVLQELADRADDGPDRDDDAWSGGFADNH